MSNPLPPESEAPLTAPVAVPSRENPLKNITGEQVLVGVAVAGAIGSLYSSPVTDVAHSTNEGGTDTGEAAVDADLLQNKVFLFQDIFTDENPDNVTYYDALGTVLDKKKLPKAWASMTAGDRKSWLESKKPEGTGPVFYDGIHVSFPDFKADSGKSLVETAADRSAEETADKRFFDGEKVSLSDAVWKICEAYEVPVEIAMGFAANQSLFDKNAVDFNSAGEMGGRGLFKITGGAYTDALRYMQKHSESSDKVRKGKLGLFEKEWTNRFVQIEVFCAYYRHLYDGLTSPHGALKVLTDRLNVIDPSFSSDSLEELAVITAYYSGPTRVMQVVEAFAELSDDEIKKSVGEPPYGTDTWSKLLIASFGTNGIDQRSLDFAGKVYAMSAMVSEEGADYVDSATGNHDSAWMKALSILSAMGAVGAGSTLLAQTSGKKKAGGTLSRRDMIKGLLGGAALATPVAKAIGASVTLPDQSADEEEVPPPADTIPSINIPVPAPGPEKQAFPEVVAESRKILDDLYADLRKRKRIRRTANEKSEARLYVQPEQDKLIKPTFEKIIGKDLTNKMLATLKKPQSERNYIYDAAAKKVKAYRDKCLTDGTFVPLKDDNGASFCEGVGTESGIANNHEWMCLHKQMPPILETMTVLVNHQIDLFNADPSAYGIKKFPKISHISAHRISGALRGPEQTKNMLNNPAQAKLTTKSLTVHWTGQAVDAGSYANGAAHMVRVAEDMLDEDGKVALHAGQLLSNSGFGTSTREFLSIFMGRALFAMRVPLETIEHIRLMPLWEPTPKNWHIASAPV